MSLKLLLEGQLRMLNTHYDVVAVSSSGNDLDAVANREGVRTVAVDMERRISPLKDIVSLVRLVTLFHKERPQIVHSITPKAGLLSMIAAWLCRVPVRIHTFTGLVFPTAKGFRRQLLMMTDRITCMCATHINPEGKGVKNDLQRFRITSKPLTIIANGNVNGINLDDYKPSPNPHPTSPIAQRSSSIAQPSTLNAHRSTLNPQHSTLNPQPSTLNYTFIGRIVGDKGINELIKAFTMLRSELHNVTLTLVGDFEERYDPVSAETKKRIIDDDSITLTGWQDDIRPYLDAADIFVFPSYREGFPNTLLQAGAMSLPCIVTDVNGCNEIIIDGENGLIVPPRDAVSLHAAMKRLATDAALRRSLSSRARQMIACRYDRQTLWAALLSYYDRACAERGLK